MSIAEQRSQGPDLASLRDLILTEHRTVLVAAKHMVEHAITCGELLNKARELVEDGSWESWLQALEGISRTRAYKYMRLARHSELVRRGSDTTIDGSLALLSQVQGTDGRPSLPEEKKSEIRSLRGEGLSLNQVAEVLDLPVSTVWYYAAPGNAKKVSQRQAGKRRRIAAGESALREKGVARYVRTQGGPSSASYGFIRRAAQALDTAITQATHPKEKVELRAAMTALHEAEDAIVRALRERAPE